MAAPPNPLSGLGHSLMLFAASRGVPMDRLLAAAGLGEADLLAPGARLSEAAVLASMHTLERLHPSENVALALSRTLPVPLLGPLDWFVRRAPDLGTLLALLVDHGDLISERLELALERSEDEVAFRLHHPLDDEDGGLGAELALGFGLRALGTHFTVALLRVEFRHAPRGPVAAYADRFGVPVRFGAAANRVVLRPAALGAPNRTPVDAALLPRQVRQLRADLGAPPLDGLEDVRRAIAAGAAERDYGAEGLARRLGTSLRALQRRLRDAGTSARALLEEARHAEALRLLDEPRWSVAEVADALGFESERGFRKAFERWTGRSPSRYRRGAR